MKNLLFYESVSCACMFLCTLDVSVYTYTCAERIYEKSLEFVFWFLKFTSFGF